MNTQTLDDADDNEEDTGEASTAFNAGATLNFGKLQVDGIIGNGTILMSYNDRRIF